MILNIAAIQPATQALGPGKRFALWVQGCCFSCKGCISVAWQANKKAILWETEQLAQKILQVPDLEGITISGGEPMLQAEALSHLLQIVKIEKKLTTICFTGFNLEKVLIFRDKPTKKQDFIKQLDVIIAGKYIESLNDGLGLRGSSNQKIYFQSSIYAHLKDKFLNNPRKIELYLQNQGIFTAGIPPLGFNEKFDNIMDIAANNIL